MNVYDCLLLFYVEKWLGKREQGTPHLGTLNKRPTSAPLVHLTTCMQEPKGKNQAGKQTIQGKKSQDKPRRARDNPGQPRQTL